MNARTSWGAKSGRTSDQPTRESGDNDLPLDDLLDARFDEEGRLSQIGRGARQRVAEKLDPRPPALSADELERAVQKLSQGLEAIERQGRAARVPETRAIRERPDAPGEPPQRDFVTYSLDRLEARLEALSERLRRRSGAAPPDEAAPASLEPGIEEADAAIESPGDPSFAVAPDADLESDIRSRIEEAERARQAQAAAEQRRRTEVEEARRDAEMAAAAEARRQAEIAEAIRRAEAAEAERRAEAAEAERRAAAARREAEATARLARQFADIETRIEALQKSCDENQIEPVRHDLLELLQQIEGLSQNGRSVADALEHVSARLDEMEVKVNAARNMAGNRLGDIQDRLTGLAERLDEVEVEIPGFDAVRENQSAILERFDRMEGLVQRLASPEELLDRVDGLKRHLQSVASQREVGRIEEHILHLAERLDSLPEELSDGAVLSRIEGQLEALATEIGEARRQRNSAVAEIDQRLAALSSAIEDVGESGRTPDLSGVEDRLTGIGARLEEDRRSSGDSIVALDVRLAALTAAIEAQENDAASEILANLTQKIDSLGEAIELQDAHGARRGIDGLDRKLEQLSASLGEQAEHLSRAQLEPLETRLDAMQEQLEELSRRARDSSAQFGPFAKKLDEIANRVTALGAIGAPTPLSTRLASIEERLGGLIARSGDPRGLHTQLEGVVSRLELLKGRSIDPARMNELFDRVDVAIRALPEDRFDRIEQKIEAAAIPVDRFDRIERRIAESSASAVATDRLARIEDRIGETAVPLERFDRLERKIAEVALSAIGEDRLEKLERRIAESSASTFVAERFTRIEDRIDEAAVPPERFDRLERKIAEVALSAIGEDRFDRLERTIFDTARPAISEERFASLERKLEAGRTNGAAEERLARLEKKLDQIGRAYTAGGEILTQDDLAELRSDILTLRRELRSLPGLGEGEASLGEVLRTISTRLEKLPSDAPATALDLEEQIERVARLLDDPSHSRLALAHIETSLRTIEERLEETRRSVLQRPFPETAGGQGEEIETVAGLARALSDDVTVLRGSAEASERKTKDALDAVQDTLEAVVKRMAFLERDAERAATEQRFHEAASPLQAAASVAPQGAQPEPAPVMLDASPPAPEPVTEAPREASSGGLLSRLTSRQLLKRATGGRAESFSPHIDDVEDAADLPLEPGTNAPLSSALTGAPSSDTARMSGARNRAREAFAGTPLAQGDMSGPLDEGDFLSAARRAARAAAAETVDDERAADSAPRAGIIGRLRSRRGSLLAAALAIAVALAALQIIRGQMQEPGETEIATLPQAEAPVPLTPAPEADSDAAGAIDPPLDESVETAPPGQSDIPAFAVAPSTSASAPLSTSEAGVSGIDPRNRISSGSPTERDEAAMAARSATADAPATVASTDAAGVAPTATGASSAARDANVAAIGVNALPEAIGPAGLRDAASAGDAIAAFEIAARYAEGRGVQQDLASAVAWYERSGEAGLAPAQYRLGSIFEKGTGVPRDLAAAQKWYARAAEAGNVKAMHNLAVLYAEGAGGEPNLERASELFRQAAEHGVRDSQFNLAILHARGLGVSQDLIEAYKWFAVAASSGDEESLRRRDIIAAALSEEDRVNAEAAAAAFQPLPLVSEANEIMLPDSGWGEDTTSVEIESDSDLVALVQKLLAEKGIDPGPADGLLGKQTIQAITTFQERAGLPATGAIDTGLMAALQEEAT